MPDIDSLLVRHLHERYQSQSLTYSRVIWFSDIVLGFFCLLSGLG